MLVWNMAYVCLLGSNLNVHAKQEKLTIKRYNRHLNPSPKRRAADEVYLISVQKF
jgi:hypothetical protein